MTGTVKCSMSYSADCSPRWTVMQSVFYICVCLESILDFQEKILYV